MPHVRCTDPVIEPLRDETTAFIGSESGDRYFGTIGLLIQAIALHCD